jgi:hypothetical protein
MASTAAKLHVCSCLPCTLVAHLLLVLQCLIAQQGITLGRCCLDLLTAVLLHVLKCSSVCISCLLSNDAVISCTAACCVLPAVGVVFWCLACVLLLPQSWQSHAGLLVKAYELLMQQHS